MRFTDTLVTFGDSWPCGTGLNLTKEKPFGKILSELLQIENYVNCAVPASSNDRTVLELLNYVNSCSSVKNHLAVFFITTPTRKIAIQPNNQLIDINLHNNAAQNRISKIYYTHLYSLPQEKFDLQRNILSLQRICNQLEMQDFYIVGWSDIDLNCPGIDQQKIYAKTCAQILGYANQDEFTKDSLSQYKNQYTLACGHPNQQGHQLIADSLHQWIKDKIV